MQNIIEWVTVIALIILVVAFAIMKVVQFNSQSLEQKKKNIKEWLLYAVAEAEKVMGSGTGELKLRMVYDWAVEKFPFVAFIKFEVFSEWVDEALVKFKEMLESNEAIAAYVSEPALIETETIEPIKLVEPEK